MRNEESKTRGQGLTVESLRTAEESSSERLRAKDELTGGVKRLAKPAHASKKSRVGHNTLVPGSRH